MTASEFFAAKDAQIASLRAALRKYGQHEAYCYEGKTTTEKGFVAPPYRHCTCGLDAALASPAPEPSRQGIYVASKVKHAEMWRKLCACGAPIISTWIYEAGEGQTANYAELAERCLREVKSASKLVLYCEPGDILKGALLEVGTALACGIPVYCVGMCESLSRVFMNHPLWHTCTSVHEAVGLDPNARPSPAPATVPELSRCTGTRKENPMSNDIPRRCRLDLMTPAELAIYDAAQAVESGPADARLTEAVNLLSLAREKVADFVDGISTASEPEGKQADLEAYRLAPSGEGPLADEWKDKPHRLIYDLVKRVRNLEAQRTAERRVVEAAELVSPSLRCRCPRTAHGTVILSASCPACELRAALSALPAPAQAGRTDRISLSDLRVYLKHQSYCAAEDGDGYGCCCGLTEKLAALDALAKESK